MARIAVVALGAVLAFFGVRKVKRSRAAKRADGTLSGDALETVEEREPEAQPV